MKTSLLAALALLGSLAVCPAQEDKKPTIPNPTETPSPKGAKVYIIGLKDGKTVKGPVTIRFGLKGMGVCPAGLYLEHTGHHQFQQAAEPGPARPRPANPVRSVLRARQFRGVSQLARGGHR